MNSAVIRTFSLLVLISAMSAQVFASTRDVRGFTLTQDPAHLYDAALSGQPKTEAQAAVDAALGLGANHIILMPEARIPTVTASTVVPLTPPGAPRAQERARYLRLIQYIHSLGMTVGIRPIMLVETKNNSSEWHGNIRPADPAQWFDAFRAYLDTYVAIARAAKVAEFTMAAELYSMTVGIEDQWPAYPYGFPREFTQLARELKQKLGTQTRLMYDINYTDATLNDDGTGPSGGELERWRYRLADLKNDPNWGALRDLWLSFDALGLDVYRSLHSRKTPYPTDPVALLRKLTDRANQFATDVDAKVFEIEQAVGEARPIIIKEIGFKSCTGCFIDPFTYDDPRLDVNLEHQALSYRAIFDAFIQPEWPWLKGISFWDFPVNPARSGTSDPGFSPRGKPETEKVIREGWKTP